MVYSKSTPDDLLNWCTGAVTVSRSAMRLAMSRVKAVWRLVWAVPVCLLVSGCAVTVVETSAARAVPAAQLLAGHSLQHSVPVVVKRNGGLAASACRFRLFVDGAPVADLWPEEKVAFTVAPGRLILSASILGLCTGQLREIAAEFRPDERRVFLLDVGAAGNLVLQETAF